MHENLTNYDTLSRYFHWWLGLLLLFMIGFGYALSGGYLKEFGGAAYILHKSIGATLLILFILRIMWRVNKGFPLSINRHSKWIKWAFRFNVVLLYLIMILFPLSGALMSYLSGRELSYFGLLTIPGASLPDPVFASFFHQVHCTLGYILGISLTAHISGVLYHHVFLNDPILKRMVKPKKICVKKNSCFKFFSFLVGFGFTIFIGGCAGLAGGAGASGAAKGATNSTFIDSVCQLVGIQPGKVWLEKVNFKIAPNVNNDSPLKIELVIPYTEHLLDHLKQFSAREYFQKSEQIRRDNPGMVQIYTWEAVPGLTIQPQTISPNKPNGAGILIFANYQANGDHRYVVSDDREILIMLGRERFEVRPTEPEKTGS